MKHATGHRSHWRRLLALWCHQSDVLNLLNQFARGDVNEFCDVIQQYSGGRRWAQQLHEKLQELSL